MLVFKGIQKTTLIDFPGKVASTLFLPKCNFRCPFCYNRQLVLNKDTGIEITGEKALEFLLERKGFLDGVCISGGEPLLYPELVSFCKKAKQNGFLVKIDTNGSKPKALRLLLDQNAVDYLAMDIKGSQQNYDKAAGTKVDIQAIKESVGMIKKSGLDYEFRMTIVPGLHNKTDILLIGNWLKGSKRFVLQQFNSSVPLLDKRLEKSKPYSKKQLQHFAKTLAPFFAEVKVRGL